MRYLIITIVCLLLSICGISQTQEYLSSKQIYTSKGKLTMKPIMKTENTRVFFAPVQNETKRKALVIGPQKGIDGMFSIVLENINRTTNNETTRKIYYDGLEYNEKRIVIVTTEKGVITAVSISFEFDKSIFTTLYTNIKPVYQE